MKSRRLGRKNLWQYYAMLIPGVVGCALCIAACPLGLLKVAERKVNRKGYPYVVQQDEERCTGCTACGVVCPDGCITIYRTKTDNP